MRKTRILFCLAFILTVVFSVSPLNKDWAKAANDNVSKNAITSEQAQKLLIEGNKRFFEEKFSEKKLGKERRNDLLQFGQNPFAIIVSCSDSRVPPELIFDQALGDLFVIRVAGNVVDTIEMGSIEYGAEHLHSPLIVVLGHESCGAVKATVDGAEVSENIGAIAKKIQPAVEDVKAGLNVHSGDNNFYEAVTDENVNLVVNTLLKNHLLEELIKENKLKIVGAKYHQESGKVEFFETVGSLAKK